MNIQNRMKCHLFGIVVKYFDGLRESQGLKIELHRDSLELEVHSFEYPLCLTWQISFYMLFKDCYERVNACRGCYDDL